jgi:glycosyltransferase involved in cell wall biosynthesis
MRVAILGIKQIPAVMGADRTVESLLGRLPAENDYIVYVVRNTASTPAATENLQYVRIPALPGKHLRAASYFCLSSLHAVVRGRYDVVHVHNSDFGAFCFPLRLRRGVRIVGTFHGDPYARGKWGRSAKLFLRFSEWCFVRAAHTLTSVTPVKRVARREVQYIPNGIDAWTSAGLAEPALLEKLGLSAGGYVMFACGRLDQTKGLHHLLRAYRRVPGSRMLLVVGDFAHDRSYARDIEGAASRDDRVLLQRTLLPREELFEVVSRSAAFVFPSEVEGMAMMLLEAISSGAKVVCSDIPENLEVVGRDYPLTFRSGNATDLGAALERALLPTADGVAEALRQRVIERFQWGVVARRYAGLYVGG